MLLSALDDAELRRQLTETLDAEIGQLTGLLADRVIDPARPAERSTPEQAAALARAIEAILTGFGLREPFTSDAPELVRQSCRRS